MNDAWVRDVVHVGWTGDWVGEEGCKRDGGRHAATHRTGGGGGARGRVREGAPEPLLFTGAMELAVGSNPTDGDRVHETEHNRIRIQVEGTCGV